MSGSTLYASDGSYRVTIVGASGNAVTIADGADITLGAKADAKSTATDTTPVSAMSVLKQISASVQAPPSQAITLASGAVASGALASGALSSGSVASGAFASGALASGSVVDGAMTTVGALADVAWASGNGSVIALLKAIANAAISTNPVQTYRSDSYVNITTKTTTTVKSGAGTLNRIIISPGTTDTLTIYDNTAGSGTLIGTVTVGATANQSLEFGCAFSTGLTIVSGGGTAGNYTVIYR